MTQEGTKPKLEHSEEIASVSDVVLFQQRYIASGIEPKVSVIQPHVKMVDVNLAYKLADLQSDASQLIGYATLFLGTCLSSIVGLIISALNNPTNPLEIAIHASISSVTLIVTIIFGILARKAMQKADIAKEELEKEMTEIELSSIDARRK